MMWIEVNGTCRDILLFRTIVNNQLITSPVQMTTLIVVTAAILALFLYPVTDRFRSIAGRLSRQR